MGEPNKLKKKGLTCGDIRKWFFFAIANRGGYVRDTEARRIREEIARSLGVTPRTIYICTKDTPLLHRFGPYGKGYLIIMEDSIANLFHKYNLNPLTFKKLVCKPKNIRAIKTVVNRLVNGTAYFPKSSRREAWGRFRNAMRKMLSDYGADTELIIASNLPTIIKVAYYLETRFVDGIEYICNDFPPKPEEAMLLYEDAQVPDEQYEEWLLSNL